LTGLNGLIILLISCTENAFFRFFHAFSRQPEGSAGFPWFIANFYGYGMNEKCIIKALHITASVALMLQSVVKSYGNKAYN